MTDMKQMYIYFLRREGDTAVSSILLSSLQKNMQSVN